MLPVRWWRCITDAEPSFNLWYILWGGASDCCVHQHKWHTVEIHLGISPCVVKLFSNLVIARWIMTRYFTQGGVIRIIPYFNFTKFLRNPITPPHDDDVIRWKHFPHYWPFVRGIHWSPVDSLTKASDAELWCFPWSAPEQTVKQTIETPVIWDAIALIMTSL